MTITGQYLTYSEYQSLGGSLEQTPFNLLEFEARKIIDRYTQNRLVNLQNQVQEVKLCIMTLIEYLQNTKGKTNISSESVGSYSVSYGSNNNSEEQSKHERDIVRNYLIGCKLEDNTPYMFVGIK